MEILSLDEQKKAILYAPKDLLWKVADEENAWLKLLKVLPEQYYHQFLGRLRLMGVSEPGQMKNMAKVYIQNKVRADHLQEAIASVWNPSSLEDATSYLKENGFLNRPLMPLNLQASISDDELLEIVAEAKSLPAATRMRLARKAKGISPKVGNPPDGASPEAAKAWNKVLRDPKRRKTILTPSKVEDQWGLAHKFWLRECAQQGVPAYQSPAASSSSHAKTALRRSYNELHNSLCSDGYTMSRPASRLIRQLFDQLVADGHDLGQWLPIKPKTPKGI